MLHFILINADMNIQKNIINMNSIKSYIRSLAHCTKVSDVHSVS